MKGLIKLIGSWIVGPERIDHPKQAYSIFWDVKELIVDVRTNGDELSFSCKSSEEYQRTVRNIRIMEFDSPVKYIKITGTKSTQAYNTLLWEHTDRDLIPSEHFLKIPPVDDLDRVIQCLEDYYEKEWSEISRWDIFGLEAPGVNITDAHGDSYKLSDLIYRVKKLKEENS